MADSTGVDAGAGSALSDWEHVEQSISKILTTPIGTRVMRRDFGSDVPDLVDAKMISRNVLAIYSAAAVAVARWEPRFRVASASIRQLSADGTVRLELHGVYFPRGHHGDFTVVENATTRVLLEQDR